LNLDFTAEEVAFRDEVRTFIFRDAYPADVRARQAAREPVTKDDYLAWHRVLADKGWIAPSWPKQYGGTGWTPTQKYIWSEELARADAMPIMPFGPVMLASVLLAFGTEEQKQRFLPGIYSGDVWWCQGYSEPGAGSDLASLTTRAERITGDDGRESTISSTARRPGRRWRNTPTGASSWCGRTRRPSRRPASPSC
jgi:alkylation response protein AidB-like acyl-CoA dehydrogenase